MLVPLVVAVAYFALVEVQRQLVGRLAEGLAVAVVVVLLAVELEAGLLVG